MSVPGSVWPALGDFTADPEGRSYASWASFGDPDAIPRLIHELHGAYPLPEFAPRDYSEIYVVTAPYYGKVKTLRFRFNEPPEEAAVETSSSNSATVPSATLGAQP